MHIELVHQDEDSPRSGLVYDVDEEDDLVLKLKKLREAVVPLTVKIRQGNAWPELREKLNKETAESLRTKSNNVKAGFVAVLENIKQFALWNNKLKTVEGMYGSGVYNFFKFFKWSMGLNLMMMLLTVKRGGKNSPQSLLLSDGHIFVNKTTQVPAHKYLYLYFKHVDLPSSERILVHNIESQGYL